MMRRLMWFLLGFTLAAVPMLAFSAGVTWSVENTVSFRASSKEAACQARFQNWVNGQTGSGWSYRVEGSAGPDTSNPVGTWQTLPVGNSCWATKNGADYQQFYPFYYRLDACAAGQTRDASGQCVESCAVGEQVSTIAHYGWVSTWNADATVWGGKNPTSTCSGAQKCKVGGLQPDTTATCKGIDSLSGTQGPYPVFCWYKGTTDGSVCSASEQTAAQKLQQPDPIPCPAGTALGSVNGKSGCYAVSETTSNKTTNPDGSTVTEKTTVNPDGSQTVEKTTCDASGNCSTTRQTMDKPADSSGEVGVGTPSAGGGNGTGAGGPPGTGSGQKGETEQADFCKDNPKVALCQERLKIDETGTPSSAPGVEAGFSASLDAVIAQAQYLEGMGWLRDGIPLIWNPAANLPGGACYAWDFGHGTIDPCPTAERIRGWWSFAIVFIAGLYAWHRATTIFKG